MFRDRRDAGVQLARRLAGYKDRRDVVVLALPKGGVVTGAEIARRLNAAFDIFIVGKLGFPGQPELAVGAVAETGTVVLNSDILALFDTPRQHIDAEVARRKDELSRKRDYYRSGRPLLPLEGRAAILVDDGVATGATVEAAITALREAAISRLILAVPVAPPEIARALKRQVDEFVCMETPLPFMSVCSYYDEFPQVSDEEVAVLLRGALPDLEPATAGEGPAGRPEGAAAGAS